MQSTLLNIIILALLLVVFASFYRARHERRFRYWLAGWAFAVLHFALFLWTPQTIAQMRWRDCLHYDLLFIVGILFLLSFMDKQEPAGKLINFALSLILPAVLATHTIVQFPGAPIWVRVSVVLGQGVVILQAKRNVFQLQSLILRIIAAVSLMTGAIMLASSVHHPSWIPEEMLAQVYTIVALMLWYSPTSRRAQGVITTTIGLFTWAMVFPAGIITQQFFPDVTILPLVWNIPKFFAAVGMILIIFEEELDRTERLRESYQILFESQPVPMWVFGLKSLRFLKVNNAATERYGYSTEEFLRMTLDDIRPAEDIPAFRKSLEPDNRTLRYIPNRTHVVRDGSRMDVDIYSYPLPYLDEPARLAVVIDVTSRNAAEERLRQSQKMESLGQLTGGIAHDFNNLLAVIMGNLQLIRQRLADRTTSEELIDQVLSSAERGAELTRRLLAYSRQQPLTPSTVNVSRMIEGMHPLLDGSIGPEIQLRIDSPSELREVNVDPAQLENAILNLAVNARDAMPQGGLLEICASNTSVHQPTPALSTEIPPGNYVVVSIHDSGIGISDEIVGRVTEPFFTTKPVGQGTGLGLSMVHGFVQQSGGYMQIVSKPGVGTTVRLYLPALAAETIVAKPSRVKAAKDDIPRGTEAVLIVEDEAAIRRATATLLKSLGYKVMEAEDGICASQILTSGVPIDLLLTDVILPNGISGVKVAEQARSLYPEIAILFSSGYTQNALKADDRFKEGMNLLTKPFHLNTLALTVRKVLDCAKPHGENTNQVGSDPQDVYQKT